jgi:hypothetical protein
MTAPGRRGTAQTQLPEDRGAWLGVAVVLTVLVGWLVLERGPYGGPVSGFGAFARTLVLVLVGCFPLAVMVWAWKRLSRMVQRLAPIPVGVLSAFLVLLAVAHSSIYLERMRMGRDPAALAGETFAAGDQRFWAVGDSANNLSVPLVLNRCVVNRHGTRVVPGTEGLTVNAAHERYRRTAAERARLYNQVILQRLRVPADEAGRFDDGSSGCPD